jgi:multiple sugar transport system substrate-binding protein
MRNRPFIRGIAAAVAVAALVSACGGNSPATTGSGSGGSGKTLTMWVHTDPNYQAVAIADAAEYQKETGVEIKLSYVPWDQYGAKIVAAFASCSEPDIIQGVASWLYPQKTGGQLAEVPSDLASTLSDTSPASLAPVEYNGKNYGVPINVNIDAGPFLLYNVDAFKTAGVTPTWDSWSSYTADLQKLTTTDNGTIKRSGIEQAGGDPVAQFLLYFLRSGGTFYSADKKSVQIANQYGQAALQIMQDMVDKYKVDSNSLTDYEGIASGTAASIMYGPWYTAVLKHDFPTFQWGWAKLPPSPGQVTEAFGGTNVWAWMVPSSSSNASAAWDYIRWMSQPAQRIAAALQTGEIPAVQSLWTDPKIATDPRWAPWLPVLKDQVPLLYIGPQDPQYKALTDMVTSVLLGQSTAAAALQTAQDQVDAIIAG